jgi:bifunctional protein TilS/HprT
MCEGGLEMPNPDAFLKHELNLKPSDTLIVSVSGGNDSMALLDMLRQSSYRLVVVHFDHQKRPESKDDAKLVETYCRTHGLEFNYYALEIGGGNFHHVAHQLRTHYLKDVARIHHTPYILTAHHLDDLFENILIKLTRGSNLLGYAGMQPVVRRDGYVFVKPLLHVPKHELVIYVKDHDVPFADDQSNEENVYLRNRYRHAIIPLMHQENPTLLETVKQYHRQITAAFKFIRKQSEAFVKDGVIDVEAFKALDPAVQSDVIAMVLESGKVPFQMRTVDKLSSILLSKRPNATYQLGNSKVFEKSYGTARLRDMDDISDIRIELKPGRTTVLNVSLFTFFDKSPDVPEQAVKLCYNKLAFPLWVRRRQDGDTLAYDYGHKKLKKLLIDNKVPIRKRQELLVVTDSDDTILWVPGHYVNKTLGTENDLYFEVREDTPDAQ